jgi:hypothetical protein
MDAEIASYSSVHARLHPLSFFLFHVAEMPYKLAPQEKPFPAMPALMASRRFVLSPL